MTTRKNPWPMLLPSPDATSPFHFVRAAELRASVRALCTQSENATVVVAELAKLAQITSRDEPARAILMQLNCISPIVASLRAQGMRPTSLSSDIAFNACFILANLVFAHGAPASIALAEQDGVGAIMVALAQLAAHENVCTHALRALRHLTLSHTGHQMHVAAKLEMLIGVAHHHLGTGVIIRHACIIFSQVINTADHGHSFASSGGLELIFDILREHAHTAGTNKMATQTICHSNKALQRVFMCAPTSREYVLVCAGIDVLLSTLSQHLVESNAVESILETLRCLCLKNAGLAAECVRQQGVDLVLRALSVHTDESAVALAGCELLQMLMRHVVDREDVAVRGVPILINILHQQSANMVVFASALDVLTDALESTGLELGAAATAKLMQTTASAIQTHASSPVMVWACVRLLTRLIEHCQLPWDAIFVHVDACIDVLIRAMHDAPQHVLLQSWCMLLFATIVQMAQGKSPHAVVFLVIQGVDCQLVKKVCSQHLDNLQIASSAAIVCGAIHEVKFGAPCDCDVDLDCPSTNVKCDVFVSRA
jgi:hypothetical protein